MNQSDALSKNGVSLQLAGGSTSPGAGDTALRVSQAVLRFDRTAPGDESFRILKITPPRPNTPVVVTSGQPDAFQVAVGVDQLNFEAELTFTPEPGGTYVHLRYKPKRAGRHRATLRVRTDYDGKTIALSGRTTGLAGRLLTRSAKPRNVPALMEPTQPPLSTGRVRRRGSLRPALLIAGAACGVLSLVYANRCALWPGLCESVAVVSVPPAAATATRSATERPAPKPLTNTRPAQPLAKKPAEPVVAVERPAPARRPRSRPSADRVEPARRPNADTRRPQLSSAKDRATNVQTAKGRAADARTANARTANALKRPGGAESDLERVLNRQE